ncbi:MAG: tetratricopeptide repeat protein [Bacteroidota bacterium]
MDLRTFLLIFCLSGIVLLDSCKQQADDNSIEALQEKFREVTSSTSANGPVNQEEIKGVMLQLAQAYEREAEGQADADLAAKNWYKAAELYETNMMDIGKALQIFDKIIQTYPAHDRAADALFKKGYIYHNTLRDLDKAKVAYLDFLEKYPEHDLVNSARFEIENLGVPAKELLERIQQTDSTEASNGPS